MTFMETFLLKPELSKGLYKASSPSTSEPKSQRDHQAARDPIRWMARRASIYYWQPISLL